MKETERISDRLRGAVTVLAAALAAAVPAALLISRGPLPLLAADAFYYFGGAQRRLAPAVYSFDTAHPTNGYHPLWMWIVSAVRPFARTDDTWVAAMAWIGIALVALGTGLLARALLRRGVDPALALLLAVPGPFYLACAVVDPSVGSTWAWVTGLETPLSVAGLGLLAAVGPCALSDEAPRRARLGLAAVFVLLVLARLDDALLVTAAAGVLAWSGGGPLATRLRRAAGLAAVPALAVLAYLGWTHATTGMWLPVSGSTKLDLALFGNLRLIAEALSPRGLATGSGPAHRALLLLVPLAVAAWWWVARRSHTSASAGDARLDRVLAVYVLLRGVWSLAFVGLWHQGYWYFPICVGAIPLLLTGETAAHARARGVLSRLAAALAVVTLMAGGFTHARLSTWSPAYRAFWLGRHDIARVLRDTGPPTSGILEYDDGIVSFALGMPGLSGFGLMADKESRDAIAGGTLLDLAWSRGVRVLGSSYYLGPAPADRSQPALLAWLRTLPGMEREHPERWRWRVIDVPATGIGLLELEPLASETGPTLAPPADPAR